MSHRRDDIRDRIAELQEARYRIHATRAEECRCGGVCPDCGKPRPTTPTTPEAA